MWAAIIASVSTVLPIVLFMAGLARVGPSTASIASTIEPPFTVALAWIVFGETLGPLQLVGGALVLSAVVLLQLRSAASSRRSASAGEPARAHLRAPVVERAARGQPRPGVGDRLAPAGAARAPSRPLRLRRHPVEPGQRRDRPQRQLVPRLLDLRLDPRRIGPAQLGRAAGDGPHRLEQLAPGRRPGVG